MRGSVFVDTNVLIYAHDRDAGLKHDLAASFIADLWESRSGVLSTQVLHEFYVTVTRNMMKPISVAQARV